MSDSEIKYIRDKLEDLENGVGALRLILDRIDDLLFRKNGGKKAVIHVLNTHDSYILESKSMRRKIINHAISFVTGAILAGVVFWFTVVSNHLLK